MATTTSIPTIKLTYALAAIAATVLIQKRRNFKHIKSLLHPNNGNTRKMVAGIAIIVAFEKLVAKALRKYGLELPSSLISMIAVFILLNCCALSAGDAVADEIAEFLQPAVAHLGKWMPLYLVPPLVTLPNSLGDMGCKGLSVWLKMGGIHVTGWLVTLTTTALISKTIENEICKSQSNRPLDDNVISPPQQQNSIKTIQQKQSLPTLSNEEKMKKAWGVITASSYVLAPVCGLKPATFSTTILALLAGNSMPRKAKAIVHPLVTCALITAVVSIILGHSKGLNVSASLSHYFTKKGVMRGSSGDVFFELLGPCCAALGVRMFCSRNILFKNSVPLLASTFISVVVSLFGTTAACGATGIPPPISLTLAQRSVMSSLGISGATLLGGNPGLAVFSILLTGIYGASFGRTVLDRMGITKENVVTRGIATGASAHSIGTAALLEDEPEAAAISSVSLCCMGIFHTALCSIPAVQNGLKRLARV